MQGFGVRRETRKKARRSAVSACFFAGAEPIVRAIPSSVALTPGWAAKFSFPIADAHRRWRSTAGGSSKAWPPTSEVRRKEATEPAKPDYRTASESRTHSEPRRVERDGPIGQRSESRSRHLPGGRGEY